MKLLTKQMPTSFNLFLFGDTHLGTVLFAREQFAEFIDIVNSPYEGINPAHNYAVDHADSIEGITIDDRRYDSRLVEDPRGTPFKQAQDYIDLVRPIRKQLVCHLFGNHEWTLMKFGDLAEHVSRELGVPYGTFSARITYTDYKGHLIFKHYAVHGRKSITSTADDPKRRRTNMELILKRQLKHKAGDCLLMSKAHTHRLLYCAPNAELYITDNGDKIEQKYTNSHRADGYIHPDHRHYVNTGSFYKLYENGESGYAERAEYDPLELGFAVVLVRDRHIQEVRRVVLGGA